VLHPFSVAIGRSLANPWTDLPDVMFACHTHVGVGMFLLRRPHAPPQEHEKTCTQAMACICDPHMWASRASLLLFRGKRDTGFVLSHASLSLKFRAQRLGFKASRRASLFPCLGEHDTGLVDSHVSPSLGFGVQSLGFRESTRASLFPCLGAHDTGLVDIHASPSLGLGFTV